jgi:iduronate 2-sulfatase
VIRKFRHSLLVATLLASGWADSVAAAIPARPNVLFIAADDLRCELGAYGDGVVHSPHLDRLAAAGTVFLRAYAQQAVCNPSRASMLTGLRPDTLRVWDLRTHFREHHLEVVTLPQHFKRHGYRAISLGKVFHNQAGRFHPPMPFADPISWSEPPRWSDGAHWEDWVVPGSPAGPERKQGAVQCLDVPDEAYWDGQIAQAAVEQLQRLQDRPEPFFLAVGFWKPHLPFNAPKGYWDLYDRASLVPPVPAGPALNAPELADNQGTELRNYAGIPAEGELPGALVAELRHGHLAAISFLDAQVGKVLAELDRLGLTERTIVVFWSDHGLHVGERGLWGKATNYELDTRAPLIISAPGYAPGQVDGLVEFVDLYPTLLELAVLPPPAQSLQGESLVPLLQEPTAPGRDYAISQHPRPWPTGANGNPTHMGYTVRSKQHRYVEWREWPAGAVAAVELYDHKTDSAETVNVADHPAYASIIADLRNALARRVLVATTP